MADLSGKVSAAVAAIGLLGLSDISNAADPRAQVRAELTAASAPTPVSSPGFDIKLKGINIQSDLTEDQRKSREIIIREVDPTTAKADELVQISIKKTDLMLRKDTDSVNISDKDGKTLITVFDKTTQPDQKIIQSILLKADGTVESNHSTESGRVGRSKYFFSNTSMEDLSDLGFRVLSSKGQDGTVYVSTPLGKAQIAAGGLLAIKREYSKDDGSLKPPVVYFFGPADENGARPLTVHNLGTELVRKYEKNLDSKEIEGLMQPFIP